MAALYILRRNGDFIAAGTEDELVKRLKITKKQFKQMTTAEWRKQYPKMPYVHIAGLEPEQIDKWKPCKENDMWVYRLVKLGLSFSDAANYLGISELMAENAFNRIVNGRYGPCV